MHLCVYEDLVDFVKPGDRVEAVGIYKAMGVRVNPVQRVLKNVYRTYIDVINFVRHDKRRFNVNVDEEPAKEGDEAMEVDEAAVQDQLLKEEHEKLFDDRLIKKFKEFSRDP